jgi:hypothetical protein
MTMPDLTFLRELLPLLVPLILLQLGLMIFALFDLSRHPRLRGPRWAWILIIVFVNMLGPILYFLLAREDE